MHSNQQWSSSISDLKGIQKILLIRTDRMGDVLLTTPTFSEVRDIFPQAKIALLTSKSTAPLVAGHPAIDMFLTEDRQHQHRAWWGMARIIAELRSHQFDLAINFQPKKRMNAIIWLAGIPHRWGYNNGKMSFFLNHRILDDRHLGQRHEVDNCFALLGQKDRAVERKLWIRRDSQIAIGVQERLADFAQDPQKTLVAIHPGASDPAKCWPAEQFVRLMERMVQERKCAFVLIGDRRAQVMADLIKTNCRLPVLDCCGTTSMLEMVEIVAKSAILISNDSGPVHVAAAVDVPVVSIFTRNQPGINPERWGPINERSRVICLPKIFYSQEFKRRSSKKQTHQNDSVTQVWRAVDAIWKPC